MRKRTTSRAKETIKEATTKATEAVKETVEKTTVKASAVIEEAKDAAADIAKAPVVEEAKETVKKAVKEVAKNIDIKKFAETTIELPGFAVTMNSIEEAIKKDIYQKDSAENVLLDEQQPFIIKAQTNQITATPRTAQSLGLIAEVQTLKDNGMLDDETSKEYLLRKATGGGRGGGSTIIEKSGRKKN